MRRSIVSSQARDEAELQKDLERFANERLLAKDHAIGRNRRVAQVLCFVSLMRGANLISPGASFRCHAAIRQHFTSAAAEGKQAAHYLPGQIYATGRPLWEPLKDPHTRRRLECLFADVHDLPTDFNKADSYVESNGNPMGLKKLFASVCQMVCQDPQASIQGRTNPTVLRRAYQQWVRMSVQVYMDGAKQKRKTGNLDKVDALPQPHGPGFHTDGTFDPHMLDLDAIERRQAQFAEPVRINKRKEVTARTEDYALQAELLTLSAEATKEATITAAVITEVERLFQ